MEELILCSIEFNQRLLDQTMKGLDEVSRVTFGDKVNSINWIFGHIVATRANLLAEVFDDRSYLSREYEIYQNGSLLLKEGEESIELKLISQQYDLQNEALKFRIKNDRLEDEQYNRVMSYLLHECYHIGQISTTRNVLNGIEIFW